MGNWVIAEHCLWRTAVYAGFYSGPVADAIVSALQSRGGVMTHDDLAEHSTVELEPLSSVYKWDRQTLPFQPLHNQGLVLLHLNRLMGTLSA